MPSFRTIDIKDARKNLSALLEQANHGHTIVVTNGGKPYAAMVSVEQVTTRKPGLSLRDLRGSGKGMWGHNSNA